MSVHWYSYCLHIDRKRLGIGRKREGREGKEMKGYKRMGRREGVEGGEMIGKREGGLDWVICPGPSEFLVTPLLICRWIWKFSGQQI